MGPRLRETNLHAASSDDVKRSGHGNPAYTIDAYQHVLPRMQGEAARAIGAGWPRPMSSADLRCGR